eukprot:253936-Chlamydomonas_euryale.AAC.2
MPPAERLAIPLVGPWLLTNCTGAFPSTDVVVPLVKARAAGYQLGLRFEYVADRAAPSVPPCLTVFNISRVRRRRRRYSAAYVNGSPLLPGARGVPLSVGDIVELGLHPNRSNADTSALRLRVALATAGGGAGVDDASVGTSVGPHVRHAIHTYCSRYVRGGDGGERGGGGDDGGGGDGAARPLREVLATADGPAAAIRALKAEVARDPSSTGARGVGSVDCGVGCGAVWTAHRHWCAVLGTCGSDGEKAAFPLPGPELCALHPHARN